MALLVIGSVAATAGAAAYIAKKKTSRYVIKPSSLYDLYQVEVF
jgi:hypothetical protein